VGRIDIIISVVETSTADGFIYLEKKKNEKKVLNTMEIYDISTFGRDFDDRNARVSHRRVAGTSVYIKPSLVWYYCIGYENDEND